MESTYESAKGHVVFQSVLDRLIINQFCKDYDLVDYIQKIEENDLRKAIWLASILADSPDEKDQFQAASFAKLLYLQNENDERKAQLAYTILSRTGNLAATRHLKNLYQAATKKKAKKFKRSFGLALDFELGTKRNVNKLQIENEAIFITNFQRQLWDALQLHDHIAISAPTSAGKSFFIQHFISHLFSLKDKFRVIYIVPSRALISQTSDDFKQLFKNYSDVSIRTAFIDPNNVSNDLQEDSIKVNDKIIYCVTPERCLKLIQQGWKQSFRPDLIFIDEIQNVETNDNRAVLLEYILGEINKLWSGAKIIFAGPFIENAPDLYKKLLSIPAEDIHTYLPPVYQLRLTVQIKENNSLSILIHLRDGKTHSIKLNQTIEIESQANKSFLAPIVKLFGKPDGNLIYAAKTDWCVGYAMQFIKELYKANGRPRELNSLIKDLIDLLQEEIHPDYALIYCLKYKVAFHHGKLPDIVKNEIEYLFREGYIEYLFCTSTLLQGVNLRASRMFIIRPKKDIDDLSQFEFGNLIGRAGRIRDSLMGTIFCLEDWKNNAWSDKYYNSGYTKSVIPITEKVLKGNIVEIVSALKREPKYLKHAGDEYTTNLIKQKYLESPEMANVFFSLKEIEIEKIEELVSVVKEQLTGVSIRSEVAKLNPSIDPVLQNQLYEKIMKEGIDKWVLHDEDSGNKDFNTIMSRVDADKLQYENKPLYYQIESLVERMDKIFALWKEASMKKSSITSVKQMVFHGMLWMGGTSLAQLIQKNLEFEKESWIDLRGESKIKKINDHINKVISINAIVVTFILVKYFKLLSDILESLMTDEQKEKYKRTLLVPTMLELGSRKVDVIIMISAGIPRTIALKLSICIPDAYKTRPVEWLNKRESIESLSLKKIYLKYLFRKGYLPLVDTKDLLE